MGYRVQRARPEEGRSLVYWQEQQWLMLQGPCSLWLAAVGQAWESGLLIMFGPREPRKGPIPNVLVCSLSYMPSLCHLHLPSEEAQEEGELA